MRVLVELFDKEPIENLIGSCIFAPELVVFLCDARDAALFKEQNVYRLLRRRGLKTKARFLYFDARAPGQILRAFRAVARDYPGCVFDYTGGSDLVLLTAGAFAAENDLPGYYIDVAAGRFVNINRCEALEKQFRMPAFSIEDMLAMTGAALHGYGHMAPEELDAEFAGDVRKIWPLVHKNPKAWGAFVGDLQAVTAANSVSRLAVECAWNPKSHKLNPAIAGQLLQMGAFTGYTTKDGRLRLAFKNEKIKRSLLNIGVWLELHCTLVAKDSGFFDDVRGSVIIDWDVQSPAHNNAKNEVDVLLMRGIRPVFISCKMNLPSALALSEVKLLSEKFGGRGNRAVVVCDAPLENETRALQNRARDLDIVLLGRASLGEETLAKRLVECAGFAPVRKDPLSLLPPALQN